MAKRFGETSKEFRLIMHAADAIRDTHRGKGKRKNAESRLVHERHMAGIADYNDVQDYIVYIDIFTHDGPEDYRAEGWTFSQIVRDYGHAPAKDVSALTNEPWLDGVSSHEYNMLMVEKWRKGGHRVVLVKSFDALHGILHPWPGGEERMVEKMNETIRYKLPLMVEFGIPTYQLITAIGMLQRRYRLHVSP